MKIKLLIVSGDNDYADHLSRVLMTKHKDLFEVHLCFGEEEVQKAISEQRFDIALLDGALGISAEMKAVRLPLILWGGEAEVGPASQHVKKLPKYQRISAIVQDMLEQYSQVSRDHENFSGTAAHITVVWSPIGGSGKTTVALAFAAHCAAKKEKTLYLDMQSFSCSPVYFPQKGKSISLFLEKLDGNAELLMQSMCQQDSGSGVFYFGQPDNYDDIHALTAEDGFELAKSCAKGFDQLVVDLDSRCDAKAKKIMEMADSILLVVNETSSGKTKWEQFQKQNSIYEKNRGKATLVANFGSHIKDERLDEEIRLPRIVSTDPIVIFKSLSSQFR